MNWLRQRIPAFSLRRFVLGPTLPTHEMPHQTVGKFVGLAVFASDVLSSVAYATEEILLVLALAGAAYFGLSIPISTAISALLIVLTISYRQTIFAYPGGGGAYIVARDNLGEGPAQTAGAALLTDYILTVSVSIASGVAQIVSAFPSLAPLRVELSVAAILFMMLMNLRGVRESGTFFAIPTYFFIVTMLGMLAVGFYQLSTGQLHQVTAWSYTAAPPNRLPSSSSCAHSAAARLQSPARKPSATVSRPSASPRAAMQRRPWPG